MNTALKLADRGLIPLPLLRYGVRKLCAQRLRDEKARETSSTAAWLREMDRGPVADVPEKANEQHYEVPPAFFEAALGPHLKYSSGFFPSGNEDLETGEARMLEVTAERAQLQDGQRILELGCGWGSLTLWMAEHYPNSTVVAVSNSAPQRKFIESRAAERGLHNVEIRTADMNSFDPLAGQEAAEGQGPERFDRIVSVEMFEHMRDWRTLFQRARTWLKDDGRIFIHVFTHRSLNYPFDVRDDTDWMSQHFFSGGMMPADDLLVRLTEEDDVALRVEEHSVVSGRHYSRTAKLWRENIEQKKEAIMPVLRRTYGADAPAWFQRWRLFFLACEELFGYEGGSEWAVSHYRLAPTPLSGSREPSSTARFASQMEASATGQAVTH
ncbi:Cyclopropane-fatty-acyl-phospholipid synthase [Planctomycetes bacterium Poly30]|uniref:Cyclopropane-fatty-acyl-phospholipid synthase n=1 Tax=Saltatorellus ferox TaxID=2528018 RepID=A0A518EVB7_9BACT|nr:Cyclopropane-fatty-acyl-phospholipid synthase [Planctomycetes bacterium Poly30]